MSVARPTLVPALVGALDDAVSQGGLPTDDVLDALLPLFRTVAAAHEAGLVAAIEGLGNLRVCDEGVWSLAEGATGRASPPGGRFRSIVEASSAAIDVMERGHLDADLGSGASAYRRLDILGDGAEVEFPMHVAGYRTWEGLLGHHDVLTDVFVLGSLLASLACGLDLRDVDDHRAFVDGREHLVRLAPDLHPVLGRAVREMTEVDRQRRAVDLVDLIQRLETYRDQPDDFDLSRIEGLADAGPGERRRMVLSRLRDRLFDPTRRNRLLYFRSTQQMVDLTVASVPQLLDHRRIKPEQLLTWHPGVAEAITSGTPLRLGKYLRFEDAPYLSGQLDKIISEARRNRAEYGFAQLRLVVAFLRWHDLRGVAAEVIDPRCCSCPSASSRKRACATPMCSRPHPVRPR